MSNKGKVFTARDYPDQRKRGETVARVWAAEQTARNKIVARDRGRPLIREEVDQYALNKLSPRGRRVAGMLLRMTPEERVEVLSAFTVDGEVHYDFEVS